MGGLDRPPLINIKQVLFPPLSVSCVLRTGTVSDKNIDESKRVEILFGGCLQARRCQCLRWEKRRLGVAYIGHEIQDCLSLEQVTSSKQDWQRAHIAIKEKQPEMKTAVARTLQSSASRRHFHWNKKVGNEEDEVSDSSSSKPVGEEDEEKGKGFTEESQAQAPDQAPKKRLQQAIALSRLRTVFTVFGRNRLNAHLGLGSKVVGTLFGSRRGHVNFAFQRNPSSPPALMIELTAPITFLVKEMASGLVRIALECDSGKEEEKKTTRLIEEPVWRTFCNGKKCGYGTRRECGPKETKILKAVEPISMGAGVLPGNEGEESGSDGELMYLRAKFERIVGSKDSEAFYMMNPDRNGAPELSIYLLRV